MTSKKHSATAYEAGSSATLKEWNDIHINNGELGLSEEIFCDELIITNDDSKIPSNPIKTVDVSDDNLGTLKAYVYFDETYKYLIHGSVETIYAPENSTLLFGTTENSQDGHSILNKLRKITFECFDTSKVTNMNQMFLNQYYLTDLDVSNFDTSNVTDMSQMFVACQNVKNIDLSNFNTEKVTNFSAMFLPILDSNGKLSKEGVLNNMILLGQPKPNVSPDDEFFFSKLMGQSNPSAETEAQALAQVEMMMGEIGDVWAMPYQFNTLNLSNFTINSGANVTEMLSGLKNLKQLQAPKSCDVDIQMPLTMVEQNTTTEYTMLSSSSNGKTLVLAGAEDTPNTGFASEQLLSTLAIGLLSIVAVMCVASKKKKYNI